MKNKLLLIFDNDSVNKTEIKIQKRIEKYQNTLLKFKEASNLDKELQKRAIKRLQFVIREFKSVLK